MSYKKRGHVMYRFIVNLQSGNRNTLKNWAEIENQLIEQHISFEKIISNSQIETETFISKHLIKQNDLKAVAVIGGDGTINSVIQQLAETTVPIAIFPSGSGNDTAKVFELTDNPKEFVIKMLTGNTTSIDLLNVNGRYGITITGTGLIL